MDTKKLFEVEPARQAVNLKINLHDEFMADLPTIDEYAMINPRNTTSTRTNPVLNINDTSDDASNLVNDIIFYLWPHLYESTFDYETRLRSCTPFNIYKKIVNSIIGVATRKNPMITDENAPDWIENIDFEQNGVPEFITGELFPTAMAGIGAIAVNWNEEMQRPYFKCYDALQIAHTSFKWSDGKRILERIAFISCYQDEEDEYSYQEKKKALVYKIVDDGEQYKAIAEVYKQDSNEPEEVYDILTRSGEPFREIPVCLFYGTKVFDGIGSPPLYNAARKNLKHLNIESAFETGLTVANFPMLYLMSEAAGSFGPNGDAGTVDLKMSPRRFWHIPDSQAKLDFVEFGGSSFEITKNYLDSLESQIVQMGINVLTDQQTQRTKAQYEGEQMTNTSVLESIVCSIEKAVNLAFYFAALYEGQQKQVEVTLNRDFVIDATDSNYISQIKQLWADRAISGSTMTAALVGKELLPTTTFEDEQQKIKEEMNTSMLSAQQIKELNALYMQKVIDHTTFVTILQRGGIIDSDKNPEEIRAAALAQMMDEIGGIE